MSKKKSKEKMCSNATYCETQYGNMWGCGLNPKRQPDGLCPFSKMFKKEGSE